MSYGTIKVDTITFTDNSVDKSVSLSGLIQNPTFTGNITVTGTISGDVIRGGTTVSGATVTGTTANFVSGVFTTQISGATVTGTTASFTSGVFTNISGTTATITSGIIASGTAAAPSLAILADLDTGLFSPGANQLAVATNGTGRLYIAADGKIGVNVSSPTQAQLVVASSAGANTAFFTDGTNSSIKFLHGGGGAIVTTESGQYLGFGTSDTERLRITSAGLVGVGASNPTAKLESYFSSTNPSLSSNTGAGLSVYGTSTVRLNFGNYPASPYSSWVQSSDGIGNAWPIALNPLGGNVGIGTASPADTSNFGRALDINGTTGAACYVRTNGSATNYGLIGHYGTDFYVNNNSNGPIRFFANGDERARIDSSGSLLVGTSTARTYTTGGAGGNHKLQLETAGATSVFTTAGIYSNSDVAGIGAYLELGRSKGTALGAVTAVALNDILGEIRFAGTNGTGANSAASIAGYVDGAVSGGGANDMPGRLVFSTTADGAATPTERLRITSAGLVGIGTSSPETALTVRGEIVGGSGASISGTTIIKDQYTTGTSLGTFGIERSTGAPVLTANIKQAEDAVGYISTNTLTIGKSALKLATDGLVYATAPSSSVPVGNSVTLTDRFTITNSGHVGIGTASPAQLLDISAASSSARIISTTGTNLAFLNFNNTAGNAYVGLESSTGGNFSSGTGAYSLCFAHQGAYPICFATSNTERARIDSSGRLLVGTSTNSNVSTACFANRSDGAASAWVYLQTTETTPANGNTIGSLVFNSTGNTSINSSAYIICQRDGGTWTNTTSMPGRLVFSTTADGAASPTERMRITSAGAVLFIKQVRDYTTEGIVLAQGATSGTDTSFVTNGGNVVTFSRGTNDGTILSLRQDGTEEGTISVSGTTVSYNGAHLSRWSQLASGAERTEILRGSILSNLDEMCEWGEEDNEQLNRMKVSTVEGDKNVSGVFQCWDDDDDTYTNDFYCAMTGDFIIRVAEGVTVERGDLLTSAGDGTAKPQDDDIIRSKTIAKVTSTNVSCTYDDGSYCVPCVLMAC
jgi:hypothetical protein